MLKFTPISVLTILAFQCIFNPNEESRFLKNFRALRMVDGGYFDTVVSHKYGEYYMGADHLTASIFYFWMMYYRWYTPALIFAGFDLAMYGPMGLCGPVSGILAGMVLI